MKCNLDITYCIHYFEFHPARRSSKTSMFLVHLYYPIHTGQENPLTSGFSLQWDTIKIGIPWMTLSYSSSRYLSAVMETLDLGGKILLIFQHDAMKCLYVKAVGTKFPLCSRSGKSLFSQHGL